MTQQKQAQDEFFTCPNESCRKGFTRPLKALDFQANSGEIYEACPHCLTNVSQTNGQTASPQSDVDLKISEATPVCSHHLGYLCERPEKVQIPDECIVCKDIVTCMLKSLKE